METVINGRGTGRGSVLRSLSTPRAWLRQQSRGDTQADGTPLPAVVVDRPTVEGRTIVCVVFLPLAITFVSATDYYLIRVCPSYKSNRHLLSLLFPSHTISYGKLCFLEIEVSTTLQAIMTREQGPDTSLTKRAASILTRASSIRSDTGRTKHVKSHVHTKSSFARLFVFLSDSRILP